MGSRSLLIERSRVAGTTGRADSAPSRSYAPPGLLRQRSREVDHLAVGNVGGQGVGDPVDAVRSLPGDVGDASALLIDLQALAGHDLGLQWRAEQRRPLPGRTLDTVVLAQQRVEDQC